MITFLSLAAAIALAIWRYIRNRGQVYGFNPVDNINEARQTAGLVNAVAYALVVILDALANRRQPVVVTVASTPSGTGGETIPVGNTGRTTTIPTGGFARRATDSH